MLPLGTIQGPFFPKAQAAEYCGYALTTWENKVESEYDIPRHGPKQNRYARSVLDLFMATPEAFRKRKDAPSGRRTPRLVVA